MANENIIEVNNLSKTFNLEAGFFAKNKHNVYAVNDVSFSIKRGTTYGLAGESGCGKTTTARLLIQQGSSKPDYNSILDDLGPTNNPPSSSNSCDC